MMRRIAKGFTLIEMLLVLVIISIIIYASIGYVQQRALQMRMDRTSTQMQQILNAGLSYYVFNGHWPNALSDLQSPTPYLPSTISSPWGTSYSIASTAQLFYVYTSITVHSSTSKGAYAAANVISGTLPLAYTSIDSGAPPDPTQPCSPTSTTCYVVSSVNIPGESLNNASAINFAGMYHHGACVPVPVCPVDPKTANTMQPEIMVVPASVSGVNDAGTGSPTNAYPISSFAAYATGGTDTSPAACTGGTAVACTPISGQAATQYWRVCLQVVTENGPVTSSSTSPGNPDTWGQYVTLMAVTRCAVNNEAAGSTFSVYSN